jgi:hypothetical protein
MNVKKMAAIVLIVIGILGFVYGGFSHSGETHGRVVLVVR